MTTIDSAVAGELERTAIRTCPLCEACCGLEITMRGEQVGRIRGDRDDVFSHGYICPKGSTLKHLHEDPDRIRTPLVKRDGEWHEATWDEAFAEIDRRLGAIVDEHGRDAIGVYLGNPSVHSLGATLFTKPFVKALGTSNVFSASTVDQRPKELACAYLFGGGLTVPVPDVDRTDLLVVLGANPYASNGSLATAPDWPGRIEALRARGGRLVVVDPRRSRTAEEADVHLAIRPGTDAMLLAAVVSALAADGRIDAGDAAAHVRGLDAVVAALEPFTPELVAPAVGVAPEAIRALARELAEAPRAAVYARIGTTTAAFGTLTSWLVDVVNTVTGNLDRPGGVMFPLAAAGQANSRGEPRTGRGVRAARRSSRVRGMAETMGELPVVCLAEEIDTPGEGSIHALFTVAGNPVVSTPNAARLDAALDQLDLMVSVDIYVNETTRHADVILPSPSALHKSHYDLAFYQLALRNVASFSPAVLALPADALEEWEILARLALIAQGMGADADPAVVDDLVIGSLVQAAVTDPHSPVHGREVGELLELLEPRRGPERVLDLMLRTGPYGDGFGTIEAEVAPGVPALSLDVLLAHPHGVDLGALQPRLPNVLRTPSGLVELDSEPLLADLARLRAAVDAPVPDAVLVGRRDLRSNNSWMHNVEVLVKGKPRCTLHVHPEDAARWGLQAGGLAQVSSRAGKLEAPVEITDAVRPGVVSLPHGWGHGGDGVRLGVAREHAGVNSNLVADELLVDPLSGNAVLNGIPVEVVPA